jgi:hypothetical protein
MNVVFGTPVIRDIEDKNHSEVILYFINEVKITTEYILYEDLSMVAEIGGYLGLFLGVSLVHISGILSKLITSLKYSIKKE